MYQSDLNRFVGPLASVRSQTAQFHVVLGSVLRWAFCEYLFCEEIVFRIKSSYDHYSDSFHEVLRDRSVIQDSDY